MDNKIDKVTGKAKETIGKITDNDEMEFKGKLQGVKAELGDKWEDLKDDVDDVKDDVLDRANNFIDKVNEDGKS